MMWSKRVLFRISIDVCRSNRTNVQAEHNLSRGKLDKGTVRNSFIRSSSDGSSSSDSSGISGSGITGSDNIRSSSGSRSSSSGGHAGISARRTVVQLVDTLCAHGLFGVTSYHL